jgi:hypothetical protein
MADSSLPPSPSPVPDSTIGELSWLSIAYGAVLGLLYCLLALKWLPSSLDSFRDAVSTALVLAAAILNVTQLPIGLGLLRKQRWAAIASHRTSLALVGLGIVSLPLCLWAGKEYLALTVFPFGWGACALSLINSSDEVQALLKQEP